MEKTRLKGGSLSGTYLCRDDDGRMFVRKEASLYKNREYGFQRWYSQLKRLQRYSILYPGLFPKLLDFGKLGDVAFFDIEYVPDAVTVHEYVTTTSDTRKVDAVFDELVRAMQRMHEVVIPSTANAFDLYIFEEIEQRIAACMGNARFRQFSGNPYVYFNGEKVPSLAGVIDEYKAIARRVYTRTSETFTHGNITLENLLIQTTTGRIVFIDPYEENVIDSVLAEYSQIYQSSHSKYELYNAGSPSIDGNRVALTLADYPGLDHFDRRFDAFLEQTCSSDDRYAIRLLEVSQFARMLPFKMEIDEDKMLFFYALGSHLFHRVREQWGKEHS